MLIEFLRDIIAGMTVFSNDIQTIFIYDEGKTIKATGNHPNRLIFYECLPIDTLTTEHLPAMMVIGALPYLHSLLGSKLMQEEPRIEISYKEKNGEKICVASMKFIAKQLVSNFECTNPEILNEKDRVRQFPRPSDAIYFPFTKEMRKTFDEVARFNTPKSDVRLFTLAFDGTYVRAIFGLNKHTTNLILTNDIEGNKEQKFQKLLSLERFRSMIKLTSENGGKAGYHQNAFWVDFDTVHAIHTIATPTIREQK